MIVADVLLWKKWYGGIVTLISATTFWCLFEVAGYNLLSFVANVLLLLVVILFFWGKSASLLNRYFSCWFLGKIIRFKWKMFLLGKISQGNDKFRRGICCFKFLGTLLKDTALIELVIESYVKDKRNCEFFLKKNFPKIISRLWYCHQSPQI